MSDSGYITYTNDPRAQRTPTCRTVGTSHIPTIRELRGHAHVGQWVHHIYQRSGSSEDTHMSDSGYITYTNDPVSSGERRHGYKNH